MVAVLTPATCPYKPCGYTLCAEHGPDYCEHLDEALAENTTTTRYKWSGDKHEHRRVWEDAHGPIPEGMEIHHVDGDKHNNALENLHLCTRREHLRIHYGWTLQADGSWLKPCAKCGRILPTTEFYQRKTGHSAYVGTCKACTRATVTAWGKKHRRAVKP